MYTFPKTTLPFALSLSKGYSWFDKLTTNGQEIYNLILIKHLGSWTLTSEGNIRQKAFSVEAVDTTGCGDVFHGAYAARLLQSLSLTERLEFSA